MLAQERSNSHVKVILLTLIVHFIPQMSPLNLGAISARFSIASTTDPARRCSAKTSASAAPRCLHSYPRPAESLTINNALAKAALAQDDS
ncbi:hypothetical protein Zmor_012512 [Zophobas morio]|uniref:Uncharacterized protein n=1 Tax=Zophobas morio TaxID=2755281 RepID=A0AA38IDN5_9CUCU|nr:hypothetical protein Zmor_012512 [Zophobas morio]